MGLFRMGLWIISGQGCAGMCGPRYRWEEENAEKTMSFYSDNFSDTDVIPWNWRERTRLRIQEAYDFCLTIRPSSRWSQNKKEVSDASDLLGPLSPMSEPFEGMEQILAAVGFPSAPPPARRGLLSEDLFEMPKGELSPRTDTPPELSSIIPRVVQRDSKDRDTAGPAGPMKNLPYPFTAQGAHMSSKDRVPFPPSPVPPDEEDSSEEEDEDEDEVEGEGEDADEEDDIVIGVEGSEDPSSGRASGSMSSLGQPVASRYPFQFRRPARGQSLSSGSRMTRQSQANTHSSQSRVSQGTRSTRNRESTDSHSPRSNYTTSDAAHSSPISVSQSSGPIPMPPRHPRSRARAGTVPSPSDHSSPSPIPVVFPRSGRPRARTRVDSGITQAFGGYRSGSEPAVQASDDMEHEMSEMDAELGDDVVPDAPESEGSHEAAEREDILGLLSDSRGPSPRTSLAALRHRSSNLSHHRTHGSRSGSNSRTNSHSGSSSSRSRAGSISMSVRSRAQSLMQNIGAASHSSLELVQNVVMRSRANSSMARLEDDVTYYSSDGRTHSRSGSGSDAIQSSGENNTFGHPLRTQWTNQQQQEPVEEESRIEDDLRGEEEEPTVSQSRSLSSGLHESRSNLSIHVPGTRHQASEQTTSPPELPSEPAGLAIPSGSGGRRPEQAFSVSSGSPPDISTAAQSFVTAPATVEGATTDSSGRTVSSWGTIPGMHMADRSNGTWRPA